MSEREESIIWINALSYLYICVCAPMKCFHSILPQEAPVQFLNCVTLREMCVADIFEVQEINIWRADGVHLICLQRFSFFFFFTFTRRSAAECRLIISAFMNQFINRYIYMDRHKYLKIHEVWLERSLSELLLWFICAQLFLTVQLCSRKYVCGKSDMGISVWVCHPFEGSTTYFSIDLPVHRIPLRALP